MNQNTDRRQRYRAKIEKHNYSTGEKEFEFYQPFFENYKFGNDGDSRAGFDKENLVRDIYARNGFRSKKVRLTTIRDMNPDSAIRKKVQSELSDEKNIEDISKAGIPDLLIYKFKDYTKLSRQLPEIKDVKINESKGNSSPNQIKIETEVWGNPVNRVISDLFFVEVKSWNDRLRETQENWIEEVKKDIPVNVFWVKPLEDATQNTQEKMSNTIMPLKTDKEDKSSEES